jgi:hypothetical protein
MEQTVARFGLVQQVAVREGFFRIEIPDRYGVGVQIRKTDKPMQETFFTGKAFHSTNLSILEVMAR